MRSRLRVVAVATAFAVCLIAPARGAASEPLHYYGGEIASTPHVYLTFWGKNWSEYSTARTEVLGMFSNLSSSAWQGILTQYFGHAGFVSSQAAVSSWTDESVAVPHNVTRAGLEQKIEYAVGQQGWPGAGINNLYIILPVPGSTYDLNGGLGCGSHYFSGFGAPWAVVGLPIYFEGESLPANCLSADPSGQKQVARALSAIASHEYAELVTDPEVQGGGSHGTGWARPSSGEPEIADVCATAAGGQLSNGSWVAALWDNYQNRCSTSDPAPQVGTQTEVETTPLNGNPGWVTVKGHVFSGTAVNGKYVNVNLKKWEGGQWVLKATLQPTVNNSTYEISNWNGVGTGEWIARVVFPAQAPFSESTSNEATEGHFTIKDGYQLVSKYSGKCLEIGGSNTANGATANQWECVNPGEHQNQVFTLRPLGNSYYEIIARHSGRCIDVWNGGTGDGTPIQQYQCVGTDQQKWRGVPASPGNEYVNFIAKHSGKCMDVAGPSNANGAIVQQWTCLGAGQSNQLWQFKSVEAADIPTSTTLSLGQILNGMPGYADGSGHVDTGAYVGGVRYVNLNFQKEVSPGNWETIQEQTIHPTLTGEGYFSFDNQGLGVGQWRVRAVFPGDTGLHLAESLSGYQYFQIKSGYRLVNKYSGKCLSLSENKQTNGQAIIQWTCNPSPNPTDGQTITLVPQDLTNTYYELKVNSGPNAAGKCIDVEGSFQTNGAATHLWECLGPNQSNQLWQSLNVSGPWFAFKVKHSSKCLDNRGPTGANGGIVQQWDCNWTTGQQWEYQAIN